MSNEEHFVVGVGRLVLGLHGNDSLKGKRSVLNRIKNRVQDQFNVSIAEVGSQDMHERAVIGLAYVSNSSARVQQSIEKVVRFIDSIGIAEIMSDEIDIVNYGGGFKVP